MQALQRKKHHKHFPVTKDIIYQVKFLLVLYMFG